jgi:hypothetical protein
MMDSEGRASFRTIGGMAMSAPLDDTKHVSIHPASLLDERTLHFPGILFLTT